MKVYGFRAGFNQRGIMAADSIAEIVRTTGLSRHELTTYGQETGNDVEVATALAHPHVALYRGAHGDEAKPFRTDGGEIVDAILPMKAHPFEDGGSSLCDRCFAPVERHTSVAEKVVVQAPFTDIPEPTRAQRWVDGYLDRIAAYAAGGDFDRAMTEAQALTLQLHSMALLGPKGVDAIPVDPNVGYDAPAGAGDAVEASRG